MKLDEKTQQPGDAKQGKKGDNASQTSPKECVKVQMSTLLKRTNNKRKQYIISAIIITILFPL